MTKEHRNKDSPKGGHVLIWVGYVLNTPHATVSTREQFFWAVEASRMSARRGKYKHNTTIKYH